MRNSRLFQCSAILLALSLFGYGVHLCVTTDEDGRRISPHLAVRSAEHMLRVGIESAVHVEGTIPPSAAGSIGGASGGAGSGLSSSGSTTLSQLRTTSGRPVLLDGRPVAGANASGFDDVVTHSVADAARQSGADGRVLLDGRPIPAGDASGFASSVEHGLSPMPGVVDDMAHGMSGAASLTDDVARGAGHLAGAVDDVGRGLAGAGKVAIGAADDVARGGGMALKGLLGGGGAAAAGGAALAGRRKGSSKKAQA